MAKAFRDCIFTSVNQFWITNKINKDTAEIYLYGYIDPYDVSAGDFIKELRSLEKEYANINVRINSGGGSVFEGLAIYNAMQQSSANIETFVDGLAASMASIIALAGRVCHMSKSAMIMTHQPSVGSYGNSEEHRKNAQLLDGLETTMCSIYSAKTGKTNEECKKCFLNGKDNWFNAEEAKSAMLVDDIYDSPTIERPKEKNDAKNVWNMYNKQKFAAIFTDKNLNNTDMKVLSPAALTALNLTDTAEQSAIDTAIIALASKASKADSLQTQLTTATDAKTTAETKLAEALKVNDEKEVNALLEVALNVDKKITAALSAKLKVQYASNPTGLKDLLTDMPKFSSITGSLEDKTDIDSALLKMTWAELDKAGKLEGLKASNPEVFKKKFAEAFPGKKYGE